MVCFTFLFNTRCYLRPRARCTALATSSDQLRFSGPAAQDAERDHREERENDGTGEDRSRAVGLLGAGRLRHETGGRGSARSAALCAGPVVTSTRLGSILTGATLLSVLVAHHSARLK